MPIFFYDGHRDDVTEYATWDHLPEPIRSKRKLNVVWSGKFGERHVYSVATDSMSEVTRLRNKSHQPALREKLL